MNAGLPRASGAVDRLADVWVYLSASPLLGLTVTLLVYQGAFMVYRRSGFHPLANPVALAVLVLGSLLWVTGTPYATYFEGAQFVHFLLGPATVALAIPLHRNWPVVRRAFLPIAAALVAGAFTAVISAVGIAWAFGAPFEVLASLAPKSVTAAIAMGISDGLGGNPSLTATLVISTGILGAIMVTPLMNALKLTDYRARGFAAGVASHGIGTARAFQVDPVAGTFAGIALGLNGLITALIVPVLVSWLR
jgi:predicted murein hydrolase (TIGR00659 family)